MKKIFSMLSFVLVALAFVSCSKNSPEGVLEEYMACLQAGKYEEAIDLCYFKNGLTDEKKQEYVASMSEKWGKKFERKGGFLGVDITNVEMAEDGESAKVSYTMKYGDGSSEEKTSDLLKIDGTWKLDSGK